VNFFFSELLFQFMFHLNTKIRRKSINHAMCDRQGLHLFGSEVWATLLQCHVWQRRILCEASVPVAAAAILSAS
jgi:hypothetical protein